METALNHTTAVPTLISLTGLVLLAFWLYRRFCLDYFRQEMFRLRDQLFDEADAGAVSFNHPAYGQLRTTMNGFIRFAHRLSLLQVLVAFIGTRAWQQELPGESFDQRWARNISTLKPEEQKLLNFYLLRMNYLAVLYVVVGSPFVAGTIVLPLAFWIIAKRFLLRVMGWLRVPIGEVDDAALYYGEPC